MRHNVCVMAVLMVLVATVAGAQTDPRTLPAVTSAPTYLGSFTLPATTALSYGGMALGISADGKSLYYACFSGSGFARVSIPALGGVAAVLENCAGPNVAAAFGQNARVGGVLEFGGTKFLTGVGDYDAAGVVAASHWSGANLAAMAGPYAIGTLKAGIVAGYMAVIPQEWRALLGGPVLSGQCCISIISRSSYGPAAAVFDPLDRTVNAVLLQGYPHDQPRGFGQYSVPSPTGYVGAEEFAGGAIPSGSSSLLYAWRKGMATSWCYDSAPPCPDPTNSYKAPHGWPYQWQWLVQPLADLAAVKAGTKQPWEIKPITIPFTDAVNHDRHMGGMALDPATNRVYVVEGGGPTPDGARVPTIRVYQVNVAAAPPPPPPPPAVDCAGTWGGWTRDAGSESACSAQGTRTYTESRLFTVSQAPANGGAACPASPESRPAVEACNPPIVLETLICSVTSILNPPAADGDVFRRIRCDSNGATKSLDVGTTFTITVPKK